MRYKLLPVKELESMTGTSRRVLEKGRKYLIAIVIILSDPRFYPLKSFAQLKGARQGEKESPQ